MLTASVDHLILLATAAREPTGTEPTVLRDGTAPRTMSSSEIADLVRRRLAQLNDEIPALLNELEGR